MEEIAYPDMDDIIEINKKVGCNGAFINKGNLEFTLGKIRNAKTLSKKAATLLFDMIKGHPFVDGNKRTAFIAMELFLKMNGKGIDHSKGDEYLMERVLYDIAENRIKEESIEKIISELVK
jgi:death-on-curing protein